jgi:two-component system, OmpR family, response regulator NblR
MVDSPQILLVANDSVLADKISNDLTKAGYQITIATDSIAGWRQTQLLHPQLIAIDRSLSGDTSIELATRLRQTGEVMPILLLMARDSISDRITCLESGADDYLLKPYHPPTLLQMVRLYLKIDVPSGEKLNFADLSLDLSNHRALRGEQSIELTMKEFELLRYLMSSPEKDLTREQILENVWGYDFLGESNVIEVYIRYLRLKLEKAGGKRLIQTVRGVGYALRE